MYISLLLHYRTSTTIISSNHEANHVWYKVTFQIYQNPLELLLEHSQYLSSATYLSVFVEVEFFISPIINSAFLFDERVIKKQ